MPTPHLPIDEEEDQTLQSTANRGHVIIHEYKNIFGSVGAGQQIIVSIIVDILAAAVKTREATLHLYGLSADLREPSVGTTDEIFEIVKERLDSLIIEEVDAAERSYKLD